MRRWMRLATIVSMSSAPVCEITATVPTGLEPGAAEECREVLGRGARIQRGRISFDLLSVEELTKVRCEFVDENLASAASRATNPFPRDRLGG